MNSISESWMAGKQKTLYTETMKLQFSREEEHYLLSDARESILARLEQRPAVYQRSDDYIKHHSKTSVLREPCGAFVTLHKGEQLRGCIGNMRSNEALELTVRRMAQAAAFEDPRFQPLQAEEFPLIHGEISVLSPLVLCPDPESVEVGVHGIYLSYRGYSGVLLPQVPVEQGWNRQEYLDYVCRKAGLAAGSYKAPGAQLYTFTAHVFSEPRAEEQ